MANNIDYNSNYIPSVGSATDSAGWVFNPSGPIEVHWIIGSALPQDVLLNAIIRNYLELPFVATSGVTISHEIDMSLEVASSNTVTVEHLVISGPINTGTPYVLTETNQEVDLLLNIVNENFLNPGSYTTSIVFNAYRVINGVRTLLEEVSIDFELRVYEEGSLYVLPSSFSYNILIGAALPTSQPLEILSATDIEIKIPDYFDITSGNLNLVSNIGGEKTYQGNGIQSADLAVNAGIVALDEGQSIKQMIITNGALEIAVPIVLMIASEDSLVVDPLSLDFYAVINLFEPTPQFININSILPYTLEYPQWLEVESITNAFYTHKVTPKSYQVVGVGSYEGTIQVITDVSSVSIAVEHEVVENVLFGLESTVNWCRDETKFTQIFSLSNDIQASVILKLEIFNILTGQSLDSVLEFDLAFFQNRTKVHFGDIIKRYFISKITANAYQLVNAFFSNLDQVVYLPIKAISRIAITVGDNLTNSLIYDWIDGRPPANFTDDIAILKATRPIIRVTKKSKQVLSFTGEAIYIGKQVNIDFQGTNVIANPTGSYDASAFMFDFKDYNPGDLIAVHLLKEFVEEGDVPTASISQKYRMFPEGISSAHIMWYTEYRSQEMYEFTGEHSITTNIQSSVFETYEDLVEVLRKVDTKRDLKLIINTGFMPQDNIALIDEIISSNVCHVLFEGATEFIELVPNSKEMVSFDSAQDLYSYDVEFIINKTNALRNYTS